MTELVLAGVLAVTAIERVLAAKERRHFLAVLTAAQVSAPAAAIAAAKAPTTPRAPAEPRPVQAM